MLGLYLKQDEYYSYLDLNKKSFIFKVKIYTCVGYELYDTEIISTLYATRTHFLWQSELLTLYTRDIHKFTHLERLALIDKLYK